MLNKNVLPTEGFFVAMIHATVLVVLLLIARHPVEELAVTSAVLFPFLWLTGEGSVRLLLRILERLIQYGERVCLKLGIEDEAMTSQSPASVFLSKLVAAIMVALLVSTTYGIALVIGHFAIEAAGLTALPGALSWFSLVLLVTGTVGSALILALMALTVFVADNLSEASISRFSRLHETTKGVSYRLGRLKGAPSSPAAI